MVRQKTASASWRAFSKYSLKMPGEVWEVLGLVLSTPLTVCMVVVGRYIPQFAVRRDKWLNVQLSVGNAESTDAQKFGVTEIKYLGAAVKGYSIKRIFEKET